MWTYNTAIVLAGAGLLGLLCGLVGTFAVLRRRSLLGDVLAHATLPGLALAFLITRSKSLPILLAGALLSGLVGLAILAFLRRRTRTKDDAAMGMLLAVLFGAGIALTRMIQNNVRDGSHAGLDSFILGKTAGMILSDVLLTMGICAVAVAVIILLYKEFQLVCFDPDFAHSLGWRVALIDFTILGLLAMAVVIGLPMVGVIMVAALTIIPPVAARLWSNSLKAMLALAGLFGVLSAAGGVLWSASSENLPSGPMIVLCAAAIFALSAAAAPGRGVISVWRRSRVVAREHRLGALLGALAASPGARRDELIGLLNLQGARSERLFEESIRSGLISGSHELKLTSAGEAVYRSWLEKNLRNTSWDRQAKPTVETGQIQTPQVGA